MQNLISVLSVFFLGIQRRAHIRSFLRRQKADPALLFIITLVLLPAANYATPPSYTTFKRDQSPNYSPNPSEVMRIWMVYVGQGDGILIQLPKKYNYDPDPSDANNERSEHIDVIVDGGANPPGEALRMADFVGRMYGNSSPMIEYVVLTHHDQDHVLGITKLLAETDVTVDTIYHNGLASFRGGKRGLPLTNKPADVVGEMKDGQLHRAMGVFNSAKELGDNFIIDSLSDLRTARDNDELQGIYDHFADAVLEGADHNEVKRFQRANSSAPFIGERQAERGTTFSDIEFKVLWPVAKPKSYGGSNWGETINGNSVTFRMAYQDFSMVFTGDHNEESEPELLAHLTSENKMGLLNCDIIKVPHHGSSHGVEKFFRRDGFEPVLGVASMGDVGFKSKQMSSGAWQHPSTEIINWLGGSHRVYHTFVQERAFSWNEITSEAKRQAMIERCHLLIETDGKWFRLVEVPADTGNPLHPPTVAQTRRSNGTRWIRAANN